MLKHWGHGFQKSSDPLQLPSMWSQLALILWYSEFILSALSYSSDFGIIEVLCLGKSLASILLMLLHSGNSLQGCWCVAYVSPIWFLNCWEVLERSIKHRSTFIFCTIWKKSTCKCSNTMNFYQIYILLVLKWFFINGVESHLTCDYPFFMVFNTLFEVLLVIE